MKPLIITLVVVIAGAGIWMLTSTSEQGTDSTMKKTESKPTTTTDTKKAETMEKKGSAETMKTNTIVDVAIANGNFKTLVTAVQAAGLVETLSGAGPYTVFAPTDAAFAKLPAGTVESLLKDTEKLKSILTYHVVSGKVMASDVVKMTSAKTVNGQSVTIDAKTGVKVNNATVTTPDVAASNGVIHVIDTVLLPK
jgi:uncharacterized surface protein with fasciclin (FAS1) repeats